ncbi:MAG TPA: hypothetical protein PKJ99_04215 [Thermoanaerobaculales bacterium]|nr:hypothetical protein [Thermoanaerobaculales bacterium]
MTISKHRVFLLLTAVELTVVVALVVHARGLAADPAASHVPAKEAVAARLGLTDLAIWTEARYTRHPSQADLFSPFQDFPASLEHFPAGSVVGGPDLSTFRQPAGP